MSAGGFVYKMYIMNNWISAEDTRERFASELGNIAALFTSSGQGWTLFKAVTHNSATAKSCHCILKHSGGAKLALLLSRGANKEVPLNGNSVFNGTSSYRAGGLGFIYTPVGTFDNEFSLSDWLVFLPEDAFPVFTSYHAATGNVDPSEISRDSANGISHLHFGIKGDAFWFYGRPNYPATYYKLAVVGNIIDQLENDTGVNPKSRYAMFGNTGSSINNPECFYGTTGAPKMPASFYRERDGAGQGPVREYLSDTGIIAGIYADNDLHRSTYFHDAAISGTTRYASLILAKYDINCATEGVINGSNIRGRIDPNICRLVGIGNARGKLFEGGNLIGLHGQYVVGWDPSNGPFGELTQ